MAVLIRYFSSIAKLFQSLAIILVLLIPLIATAKEKIQLYEQEIKAGLLYNFLKYINWPAQQKTSKISVCIFGDDPFSGYLQPMEGRSVNQHIITIHHIHSVDKVSDCAMLFINENEEASWPQLHDYLADKNILTVSDINNFANRGGMIEFTRKNSHVSVILNQDALNVAKLSVQERLLKLVTVVHSGTNGGR